MFGTRLRRLAAPLGALAVVVLIVGIVAIARHDDGRVVTGSASSASASAAAASAAGADASTTTVTSSLDAPSTSLATATDGGGGPDSASTTLPTPTTVPATGSGAIGYAGCSQAIGAVHGYRLVGGTRMWPELAYGGGTIRVWANEIAAPGAPLKGYWAVFEQQQQVQPSNVIWWQMCTHPEEDDAGNSADASRVRAELLRLSPPGTKIYVSAMNAYVAPHVCSLCGPDGPARMQTLADQLVAAGLALRGPDVGALHSIDQTRSQPPGNETETDGCHPNDAGARTVLGPPLLAFFG